jgi:hypothetical protein
MTVKKVLGWILLILLTPVLIGLTIFVAGWHIWEISWASGSAIDLQVSLAVYVVMALSLIVITARKGVSLVKSNRSGIHSESMGWFLSIMGTCGVACSALGIAEIHPYYFLPLLLSMQMVVLGLGMIYTRSLTILHTVAGWSIFTGVLGAIFYVIILFSTSDYCGGIRCIGFQLWVGVWALYPLIIVMEVWWFTLGVRGRGRRTAHIQPQ